MIASRPRRYGKRAFLFFGVLAAHAAGQLPDPGWRLTVIPAFEHPGLRMEIPGSKTAALAVARHKAYGELEYATTKGAVRFARDLAEERAGQWIMESDVQIRRGKDRVIDRIIISGDDPLLPALATARAFYDHFEPMLGDGFYVLIPDRKTIVMYPRIAGRIPPEEVPGILEINSAATYPVSREVFRATKRGLVAEGVLEY